MSRYWNCADYSDYEDLPDDELYHFGILGMHWGKRRFQNKDGSLTAEGRARYGSNGSVPRNSSGGGKKFKNAGKVAAIVGGTAVAAIAVAAIASSPQGQAAISKGKNAVSGIMNSNKSKVTTDSLTNMASAFDDYYKDAAKRSAKEAKSKGVTPDSLTNMASAFDDYYKEKERNTPKYDVTNMNRKEASVNSMNRKDANTASMNRREASVNSMNRRDASVNSMNRKDANVMNSHSNSRSSDNKNTYRDPLTGNLFEDKPWGDRLYTVEDAYAKRKSEGRTRYVAAGSRTANSYIHGSNESKKVTPRKRHR